MAGFGGTVKLTGEEVYRQALKAIAADLQNVAAQQKLTAATYDKSDTSLTALSKRSEELKNKLASQQERVKTLTAALKDYQSQQDKNKTTIQNLQTQLDKEKTKLEEIARQYGTNSKEYKDQAKVVNDLEQELKELNTQYDKNETTVKKTQAALTSAEADVKKTGTAMDKLAKQAKEAGVEVDDMGNQTETAGNQAEKAANGGFTVFKGVLANLATQVINRVTDGLKTMARNVVEAGMDFDSAMSKVQAVSGASAEDMEKLTAKAKEMGETTKFSASESAEALNYMAMAGWKTEDMLGGLGGIMDLAAASGADLATTSDIVTDALTAMGYSAGDAGRLADVMAAASSNANTNVEMMGETFKYAASVAGSLGYSMEDVALATGLMANSGVKAERAGTALRSIMQRIATDTGDAATTMHEMGVQTTNADGTMRPLADVMTDLRKAMSKMTDEQKTATAKTIAGTEAMGGLLAIVNATETDYDKLTKAVKNSAGAAEKMANTMQNNVGGKMTLLKSQLEGVYLTIWKKVEPVISKTIDSISKSLKTVDWDAFGEKAGQALQRVADGFKWLIENKDMVINGVKLMIGAFATAKILEFGKGLTDTLGTLSAVAKGTQVYSTALGGLTAVQTANTTATGLGTAAVNLFNAAWAANPIGLVVTGLGLLAGGIIAATNALGGHNSKLGETDQHLRDSKKLIEENTTSWEELSKTQQDAVDKGMTEMTYYQALADELNDIVDANGRVKDGYQDRASFIVSTLKEALGIEISMTGDVIEGYSGIEKSIQDTIAAKKAKIQLDAQEALYTEALQKQGEVIATITQLQKDKATAEAESSEAFNNYTNAVLEGNDILANSYLRQWENSEKTKTKIEGDLAKQTELYGMYAYNIGQYEDNMAKYSQGKYSEMSDIVWAHAKEFESAEDAQKAALLEGVANTETQLKLLNDAYKKSGDERLKGQITEAEKTLANQRQQLKQYNVNAETELKSNVKIWDNSLDETLSQITGSNVEFKDAGDGNVQMFVDGVAQGKPVSKKKAQEIIKDTLSGLDGKSDAIGQGENLIRGFQQGESNPILQRAAINVAGSFAGSVLERMKAKFREQSPSKATREMGQFLLQGLGIGIKDEEKTVLTQAEDFGDSVIDTLTGAFEDGISTNALQALKTAIPAEFNANIGTNTSRMAEAAQNANTGLVSQFMEALGNMKIEMDDYEMGRFVDKTVTNLVYN